VVDALRPRVAARPPPVVQETTCVGEVVREQGGQEGCTGQQGGDRGSPERWVNVEAQIWTSVAAFVGGGADVVVINDGERFLQLREVGGVPFCSSAVSRGRWWSRLQSLRAVAVSDGGVDGHREA
jgi:hypothetical protein